MPFAITACSLLTPFDAPARAEGTWRALAAGERLGGQTAVDDRLLAGPEWLDRSIRMAIAVARDALEKSEIKNQKSKGGNPPLALFCGTSKGPVLTILAAAQRLRRGEAITEPQARHIQLGAGAMGAFLAEELHIHGPVHTSVTACASGMFALHRAAGAIERGQCARALVVAADASLHPLFEASFARLGVLAPADDAGTRRCDPFAPAGRGFFVSEAAAALVLERGAGGVQLDATWTGGDGTSIIAVDEMGEALRAGLARMRADGLAFVHAHATGTAHDAHELAALRAALPALGRERIFSLKGQLGHALGAAGLVSVVLSAMAHERGMTPAGVRVPAGARSLTVAQGFGGHIGMTRLRGT